MIVRLGEKWNITGKREFDPIAETSEFADHLARSRLFGLFVNRRPPFVVPNPLVKNPHQATEPMSDRADGSCVPQSGSAARCSPRLWFIGSRRAA